jgi:para-nitrobenzyl esterase
VTDAREVLVTTTAGVLSGLGRDGTIVFRGIPYGAPTGGDHRFRPPLPAAPWSGVRPAHTNGQACPQPVSPLMSGDTLSIGGDGDVPPGED